MAWRRLLFFFLGRVPFAASLWVLVALIGIANGTWAHKLPPATLALWGFGLDQLWRGRWWTLVTGAVFVHGLWMYWALLVLFVPLTVGAYEWLAGTRRVLIVYWTTDIGGALLVALVLILPLYLAGTELGRQLAYAHDVGMSGGGFGCLGAAVNRLPGR